MRIRDMSKAQLKKKIRDYEYYSNGYHKLSGYDVEVLDIRIKPRDDLVLADVLFHDYCDDHHDRYNSCEYVLSFFTKL